MTDPVRLSLERALSRWVDAQHARSGELPSLEHDDDWPSPCIVEGPDTQGKILWRPIARDVGDADFSGIEQALEIRMHPDIQSFYGSFYSNPLPMRAADGPLTLLQAWSVYDFDRLNENLIGHAIGHLKADSPLSFFIAVTDEDDLNLCVDNERGTVILERPGAPPLREIAPSLSAFLDGLTPVLID